MDKREIYREPSEVRARDGSVEIDGPDGVAVALTPDAALETGGRTIDQAAVANGQRLLRERKTGN